jgi:hypothetical protein
MPGAEEALKVLHECGYRIIIHSVRGDRPDHIREWMEYYHLPFNEITRVKPAADYYIDDKAIRFISWAQTLNDIMEVRK